MNTKYSVTVVVVDEDEAIAKASLQVLTDIAENLNVQEEFTEMHHAIQLDAIFNFSNSDEAFRFLDNAIVEIPNLIISNAQVIEGEPCTNTTAEPG